MITNPVVFDVGLGALHLFTAAILLATAAGVGWLGWMAHQIGESPLRWLDAVVGLVIGGVMGGRLFHVLIEWDYFSAQPDQITNLTNGGFDWHGALILGLLLAGLSVMLLRAGDTNCPAYPYSERVADAQRLSTAVAQRRQTAMPDLGCGEDR